MLHILVQQRRDGKAAKRFSRRLLKVLHYVPRVIVTDKLRCYGMAKRQLLQEVEHRQGRYLNNRVENSHLPTRRRERQMQRFKSLEQAQTILSAHAFIHGHFHPRRHLLTADAYRALRSIGFVVWHQETCARHQRDPRCTANSKLPRQCSRRPSDPPTPSLSPARPHRDGHHTDRIVRTPAA